MMAASTFRISAAVIVTSAARLGFLQISMSEWFLRTARYSAIYRPAWRISHTGVRSTGSRLQARTSNELAADIHDYCSIWVPCRIKQASGGLSNSRVLEAARCREGRAQPPGGFCPCVWRDTWPCQLARPG